MPAQSSYDYAVIRVVPSVEKGEFVNVGVILFCKTLNFLEARIIENLERIRVVDRDADLAAIRKHLEIIPKICAGGKSAGYFSKLNQTSRFDWLVSPSSTIIQTSPVHCGICSDPGAALDELYDLLIR